MVTTKFVSVSVLPSACMEYNFLSRILPPQQPKLMRLSKLIRHTGSDTTTSDSACVLTSKYHPLSPPPPSVPHDFTENYFCFVIVFQMCLSARHQGAFMGDHSLSVMEVIGVPWHVLLATPGWTVNKVGKLLWRLIEQQKSHLSTHARRFYGNVSKKNGDGRRSYERFEREERPKKNTKSRGYSFLQFEKNYPRGFGSQYLVHKIWSLDGNGQLECLLTSRSSKRGGRSPTNSMTN